jgi:hypothetical protein
MKSDLHVSGVDYPTGWEFGQALKLFLLARKVNPNSKKY